MQGSQGSFFIDNGGPESSFDNYLKYSDVINRSRTFSIRKGDAVKKFDGYFTLFY